MPLPTKVEIVGLGKSSHGRRCDLHACCGDAVTQGTPITLLKSEITMKRKERRLKQPAKKKGPGRPKKSLPEDYEEYEVEEKVECVKAHLLLHQTATCCVGFLSKAFQYAYKEELEDLCGRMFRVDVLYSNSENQLEVERSREHNGLLRATLQG
jgi:hypothetical protein